ncbi:hypothetical protein ACHQM5_020109 [Ranunculus cassubicifolius]
MAEVQQEKWEGKATAKLSNSTADQVWPMCADFCNLHKWIPSIDTCRHVDGSPEPGQIGCVRYCAGRVVQSVGGSSESLPEIWAYEKLLSIDSVHPSLSYEITENSSGFKKYVATIKVSPGGDGRGCVIEWSYVTNPMDDLKYEDLASTVNFCLDSLAKTIEEAIAASEG